MSEAHGQIKSVQHEPIGYIDCYCEQAEFPHRPNINKEPDYPQSEDIGQGSKQDLETTATKPEPNSFGHRVMEWH
jgi:hypothetical protein